MRSLAEGSGLRVERIRRSASNGISGRARLRRLGAVTFVEWTRMIPDAERDRFIGDVLDAYAQVGDDAGPSVFVFYQMEVELRRP